MSNFADSSSFARMIEESMIFAKQNPFQSYKPIPTNNYLGSFLTKHSGQLSNLQLKVLEQLAISEH